MTEMLDGYVYDVCEKSTLLKPSGSPSAVSRLDGHETHTAQRTARARDATPRTSHVARAARHRTGHSAHHTARPDDSSSLRIPALAKNALNLLPT